MSCCPDTKHGAQQDPHWLDTAFRHAAGRGFWSLSPKATSHSGNAEVQGTGCPTCQPPRGGGGWKGKGRLLLIQAPWTHTGAHVVTCLARWHTGVLAGTDAQQW